ncbi:unnamed protein product [Parascedosporium putredinis]|uniref:Uncharacterized protein n=1 Tax=Parascedosporium putredinis TaxID=1442378 RepID=A0A9P1M7K5_9PEZI|nr:unnamed protein product [Parascedosporium putredinis]CAI7988465.1 unnamed protein product [Parascedosporium putredinis]
MDVLRKRHGQGNRIPVLVDNHPSLHGNWNLSKQARPEEVVIVIVLVIVDHILGKASCVGNFIRGDIHKYFRLCSLGRLNLILNHDGVVGESHAATLVGVPLAAPATLQGHTVVVE